jgi:hypothetical protein
MSEGFASSILSVALSGRIITLCCGGCKFRVAPIHEGCRNMRKLVRLDIISKAMEFA